MDTEWAKALASNRTKLTKWSFETFWKGDTHQSPRRFDTMEECIVAITTKLTQHALDHEFPMIKVSMVEGDK